MQVQPETYNVCDRFAHLHADEIPMVCKRQGEENTPSGEG